MFRKTAFAFVALFLMLGMSSSAFAQKNTVLRVLIVKSDNISAYLQALDTGKEMMKKMGITVTIHVYQATYAGPDAGSFAVSIEYPSIVALAEAETKARNDKDYGAWVKSLDKLRTIVSDSIYREL